MFVLLSDAFFLYVNMSRRERPPAGTDPSASRSSKKVAPYLFYVIDNLGGTLLNLVGKGSFSSSARVTTIPSFRSFFCVCFFELLAGSIRNSSPGGDGDLALNETFLPAASAPS